MDILSIVFDHHHLFSLEHYLGNELKRAFSEYQMNLSKQHAHALDRRLSVLYVTMSDLREKLEITVQQKEREIQVRIDKAVPVPNKHVCWLKY